MEWLTWKIPVGETAAAVFDWIESNGRIVVRPFRNAVDAFIDGALWLRIGCGWNT